MKFFKQKSFEESAFNLLGNESTFDVKEAYNSLATNLIYHTTDEKSKRIAVTSSNYGEDKSSVAINLSIALASNLIDKNILLIDADMRKPHIKSFMEGAIGTTSNASGLSDYLNENSDKPEFLKSHIKNLDVLYSGDCVINPSGLLNSDRMGELLSIAEGKYDFIIIDTPPVNTVSDALSLVDRVSGYLITTRAGFSTVPMLNSASEALASVGAKVFGVVLTESKK